MKKSLNVDNASNNSQNTKTGKLILTILITPIVLVVLSYLSINFIINPIIDRNDQAKFIKLDAQMKSLFQEITTTADIDDNWKYDASCEREYSGPWALDSYLCKTQISMEKTIKSVYELNNLHTKYYPIVDSSSVFSVDINSNLETTGGFGKEFNVSLAYGNYNEGETGIKCSYEIQLTQTTENINYKLNNTQIGRIIENNEGRLIMITSCSEQSRGNWLSTSIN